MIDTHEEAMLALSAMQRAAVTRPEPRPCFNVCPACDGAGEITYGRDPTDECAERCDYCHGKGEIEEEAAPITLEDLDEIAAELEIFDIQQEQTQ